MAKKIIYVPCHVLTSLSIMLTAFPSSIVRSTIFSALSANAVYIDNVLAGVPMHASEALSH